MKDGGSAFPNLARNDPRGGGMVVSEPLATGGMSLRDFFAASALAGLIAKLGDPCNEGILDEAAGYAYELADYMIAERVKV